MRRPYVGVIVSETWGEDYKSQEFGVRVMEVRDLG
jgi:hypothetical protein